MIADTNVEQLINTCCQKVIDGWTIAKVRNMLKKEYDCDKTECDNIVGAVKKFIKQITEDDVDITYESNIQRCLFLYEKAMEANNIKVAKDIIDIMNKMISAYTQKIDLSADVKEYHFKFSGE